MPGTSASRSPVQFQNSYNIASLSFLSVEYSNHPEQIVFFAILREVTSLFCQLEPPVNHLHDEIQVNICPEQYLNMIGSSSDIEAKTCRHFLRKSRALEYFDEQLIIVLICTFSQMNDCLWVSFT